MDDAELDTLIENLRRVAEVASLPSGAIAMSRHDYVYAAEALTALRAERDALTRDRDRLDALEKYITIESSGHELYPIGADKEFGPDGNTIVRVYNWVIGWKSEQHATFREAIDFELPRWADGITSVSVEAAPSR